MNSFIENKAASAQAKQDLRTKIRLEDTFKPELRSLFATIRDDFKTNYAARGTIIDANLYVPQWTSTLQKHYKRVQKAFGGSVKAFYLRQTKQEDNGQLDEELLALALLEYRDERSNQQAEIISDTNNKDLQDAVSEARQSLAEQGELTDNRSVAVAAAAILARKFAGRVNIIAIYETQNVAENARYTEAQVASGRTPTGVTVPVERVTVVPVPVKKQWVTMGDAKVRASHRAVNGQVQNIDQPFQVGTSLLMYPGDSSLGASLGEIINCRCWVRYSFGI